MEQAREQVAARQTCFFQKLAVSCARSFSLNAVAEIFDGELNSVFKGDTRFPAEQASREVDIRLADFGIVLRQRLEFNLRAGASELDDVLGKLADRHLARVADV